MNNNNYQQVPPPLQSNEYKPPQVFIQQAAQMALPRNADHSVSPTSIQCPHCNQVGVTQVKSKVGSGTLCCAFILLMTTFCCCIPFLNENCQDKLHTCTYCQAQVGIHEYKVC
ncbi:LITAF-like zinc ribbon domain protein (macronuclear) [Tetrahymena thermophila SB210]|uniref:LITAF-like zinc ribbon domain protein n=1 Tax=Tetrahymena thermophila (strain SB210) TaxID=312017 RepID=Q22BS5_TETTS|nr:LITAF-like zinc ribbon domain protein [Tetrahymena thermophila SB210]EAR82714.1 LITAF-like zinc ribbon domain protein [Tetrahymena thermophila SB210]|eukprot:XP_001030377.1 LITAF-like zinc ribbon domain protein [Tetrahymena thermophila SB210]